MKLKEILTFSISILVTLGLVITTFAIFNPIKVEKQNKLTLEKIQTLISDAKSFEVNEPTTVGSTDITLSTRVMGNNDSALGYVYEINEKNGFGNIKLLVAANAKSEISKVTIVELNQTMYQDKSEALIKSYVNQKLTNIIDLQAGATSVSLNTIMSMFSNLGEHHQSVPNFDTKPPYFDFFGEEYEVLSSEDKSMNDTTIIVETISNDLGLVFTLTKEGIYNSDSETKKPITLVIGLDKDGKILGIQLPTELYQHSSGGYYNNTKIYAESFVGTNINDFLDGYTGASSDDGLPNNSRYLVHTLFVSAKEVYQAWKKKT